MNRFGKAALAAGLTAMVATTPLSAFAADGSRQAIAAPHGASVYGDASDYRRRRWRHHDRIDGGDILAGIGILAGIAIIADAASKADRNDRNNRRYDERPYDAERPRDYDRTPAPPLNGGGDVGSAVSACTDAAERAANGRVDEIGSATREGAGWRVMGEIGNEGFACTVTDGRVDDIRIGGREISNRNF